MEGLPVVGLQELKILDQSRHNPAVGISYETTPLGRLLVVGMSHYGDSDEVQRPDFTWKVVNAVIGGKKMAYFTKIANLFRRPGGGRWTPEEFYSSIAFYNYLPEVYRVREPVSGNRWSDERASSFFFAAIDQLKPDQVLVTGEELWRRLASRDPDRPSESRDSGDETGPEVPFFCREDPKCRWYRVEGADCCLVGAITHPSTAKFNKTRGMTVEWVRKFMACKKGAAANGAV
jgi:hypothetical protein